MTVPMSCILHSWVQPRWQLGWDRRKMLEAANEARADEVTMAVIEAKVEEVVVVV